MTRKHKRLVDEGVSVLGSFVVGGILVLAIIGALTIAGWWGV